MAPCPPAVRAALLARDPAGDLLDVAQSGPDDRDVLHREVLVGQPIDGALGRLVAVDGGDRAPSACIDTTSGSMLMDPVLSGHGRRKGLLRGGAVGARLGRRGVELVTAGA